MKRVRRLRTAIIAASSLCALLWATGWAAHAAEVKLNGHTFTLPDGFEIEVGRRAAAGRSADHGRFDEQGRLYVADSSGSNDKVDEQLAEKPHRIVRLEDTDGDGRFDTRARSSPTR